MNISCFCKKSFSLILISILFCSGIYAQESDFSSETTIPIDITEYETDNNLENNLINNSDFTSDYEANDNADSEDDEDSDDETDNEETIQYVTEAWSLDSAIFAQVENSNIIIKDGETLTDQYTIETPYEKILNIQFVNPGFYNTSENVYYISFVTDSGIVEMRQLGSYSDDFGETHFYDEIIFSMQGAVPQEEIAETTEDSELDDQEDSEATDEELAEEEEEKYEYQALALIRYKNTDSISFRLKISYIPKPYILGISFASGYVEYKLLQPFYFGGFIEPHIGIPQKKFPYKYELGGAAINGPLIIGGKFYFPFGICVFPFQKNIEFFVELQPGLSLNMMWNAKFGGNTITSKLYPAFYGALRTGVTYKGFTAFVEGTFDAILGFGVSAGIGYSINIDPNPKIDHAPSLE